MDWQTVLVVGNETAEIELDRIRYRSTGSGDEIVVAEKAATRGAGSPTGTRGRRILFLKDNLGESIVGGAIQLPRDRLSSGHGARAPGSKVHFKSKRICSPAKRSEALAGCRCGLSPERIGVSAAAINI